MTAPLQGFAQLRDPSKLDGRLGGLGSASSSSSQRPITSLHRSTCDLNPSSIYGAGSRLILLSERVENIEHEVVKYFPNAPWFCQRPEQRPAADKVASSWVNVLCPPPHPPPPPPRGEKRPGRKKKPPPAYLPNPVHACSIEALARLESSHRNSARICP